MTNSPASKPIAPNDLLFTATEVSSLEGKAAELAGTTLEGLMELAGKALFDHIKLTYPRAKNLLFVAGTGNNGGDAYVAARLAFDAGYNVTMCAISRQPSKQHEAHNAYKNWAETGAPVHTWPEVSITEHDLIIDGLLGTGLKNAVSQDYAACIEALNKSTLPIISIDVPSGLNATTGQAMGTVINASSTVTMIGMKSGLVTQDGRHVCGDIHLAQLGIGDVFRSLATPIGFATHYTQQACWPTRNANSHKGTYGKLLCIGGNQSMSGAIRMSAEAALRCGVGLVKVYCHPQSQHAVLSGRPELMAFSEKSELDDALKWADAIVLGPGLGKNDWARQTFAQVERFQQRNKKPLVLDADGLNWLSQSTHEPLHCTVISPHFAEASRLLGCHIDDIKANPFKQIRQLQQKLACFCLLKGAGSILDGGHHQWVFKGGNPGMASAGMGDVLSGILAACLLQYADNALGVRMAVNLHNEAADRAVEQIGEVSLLASDVINQLPASIQEKYR